MTELVSAPDDAVAEDDVLGETRQFVTFLVGSEVFAVDMGPVQEIIRVPEVVRVPLAPPTLEGLSNLRGRVLPIISLRRIFGFGDRDHDDATRAVVIEIGQPLGFVVDRVSSVIDVEPQHVEGVEQIRSTIDTQLVTGILKGVGGHAMVMVLDFARLIETQFAAITAAARASGALGVGDAQPEQADDLRESDELQLVSFSVAGQEYALDIARVQEIVQIPETIVHVPNSPQHALGLMTLRERLLPLVSLRSLFKLPQRDMDERSRVVVIAADSTAVGIVTDSVSEVLRVPRSEVDVMPGLLARDSGMTDITRICRLDGGKRLVSIIAVENMFSNAAVVDAIKALAGDEGAMVEAAEADEDVVRDEEEQVVVFHLAEGEFGVPIDSVQEIVRVPGELTHVPKAPSFVEGVINLRGSVLPVIDQRKRLDLPGVERNDRQRIMVFLLAGVRTGFIVDAVTEVLKIPKRAIEPSPRLSSEQARLLGRVANLEREKRMIQLIDPAHLIDEADQLRLARMA